MPRKTFEPVSAFGPELLAALITGSEKRLDIKLPSFETGFIMRARLYALRAAMKREAHPQVPIVYRALIANPTKLPDGSFILTIRPKDAELSSLLKAAGVTLPELPSSPFDGPLDNDHESRPMEKDYLDSLLKGI